MLVMLRKCGLAALQYKLLWIALPIASLSFPVQNKHVLSCAQSPTSSLPFSAEGLVYSMPCRSNGDGNYELIQDFYIDDWLREKIMVSAGGGPYMHNPSPGRTASNFFFFTHRHTHTKRDPSQFVVLLLAGMCLSSHNNNPIHISYLRMPSLLTLAQASEDELIKERNCVGHLIPNATAAFCDPQLQIDTMLPGEN
jgi:hypothetical protein